MKLHQEIAQAANMGFGVIGAGRCYLHQQQHGSICSGRTNTGEHFIISCTSAKHQQRLRADVFQIPQQRQALFVSGHAFQTPYKLQMSFDKDLNFS